MTPPDDTATIEGDLPAVARALSGGVADHDDSVARELQVLALELRAAAPAPAPEFAQRMERSAQRGFEGVPRRARPPGPLAIGLRRYLLPVVGTLVPLALIVGLIFAAGGPSLQGGGDDNDSGSVASDSGGGGG